jgi:RecA/RadA recombinase
MHYRFDARRLLGEYKAKSMPSATAIRHQVESSLSQRIPSALTPLPRTIRPVTATGIPSIDAMLEGGLPVGAITELVGPECSGRTAFALSFVARLTQSTKVCAWVDVSDTLHPESAAASGVDLPRLLWIRCGGSISARREAPSQLAFALPKKYLVPPPIKKGLHGGGFGSHPRNETRGLSDSISSFMQQETFAPRCGEPQRRVQSEREIFEPTPRKPSAPSHRNPAPVRKPWTRIEQALRVTDLLLQGGGFSAIVLDMGSIAPEYATRVPLATWFRYRAAAERTQVSVLLLTQCPCAKSSVELLLRFNPGEALRDEATVFTGIRHCAEVVRKRFSQASTNVVPLRKPPQKVSGTSWKSRTAWARSR